MTVGMQQAWVASTVYHNERQCSARTGLYCTSSPGATVRCNCAAPCNSWNRSKAHTHAAVHWKAAHHEQNPCTQGATHVIRSRNAVQAHSKQCGPSCSALFLKTMHCWLRPCNASSTLGARLTGILNPVEPAEASLGCASKPAGSYSNATRSMLEPAASKASCQKVWHKTLMCVKQLEFSWSCRHTEKLLMTCLYDTAQWPDGVVSLCFVLFLPPDQICKQVIWHTNVDNIALIPIIMKTHSSSWWARYMQDITCSSELSAGPENKALCIASILWLTFDAVSWNTCNPSLTFQHHQQDITKYNGSSECSRGWCLQIKLHPSTVTQQSSTSWHYELYHIGNISWRVAFLVSVSKFKQKR